MSEPKQFEQSLAELQEIVAQLEKGDLSLENSLQQFEKGIAIARKCQETLVEAEQKIEYLSAEKTRIDDDSCNT